MKTHSQRLVNKRGSRSSVAVLIALLVISGHLFACEPVEDVHHLGRSFTLRVRYESTPIAGALVRICTDSGSGCEVNERQTDAKGDLKVDLKPGQYYMWISHVGLRAYSRLLVGDAVGSSDLKIRWGRYAQTVSSLSGSVIHSGQSKRPATGTEITIKNAISGEAIRSIAVDQSGRFDAGNLPPGLYSVAFQFGDSHKLVAVQAIKIKGTKSAGPLLVTLSDSDCGPYAMIATNVSND